MLVLTRKRGEAVLVNVPGYPPLRVSIVRVMEGHVRIGFDGPREIKINREQDSASPRSAARTEPARLAQDALDRDL